MGLHSLSNLNQITWKLSIENDWLKQMNDQKCDKESTQMFRRKYGTNQNYILRPGNEDIYAAGRQDKSLTKTINQFVAPTQLEHLNETRNIG